MELLDGVPAILAGNFVGAYLFGSLTTGDFDQASDIDVVFVTDGEVSGAQFAALESLHTRIAESESPWATEMEVSYIPRGALRRFDPAATVHPRLDRGKGERLYWMSHDRDWIVQRHLLRERGVSLDGPPPHELIDPVSPDDMRCAMPYVMREWGEPRLTDSAILQNRGYQSFMVLSLCRILYTLQTGEVVSKPAAATWARENLGEQWAPLIDRATAGRQVPREESEPRDVQGTLDFIRLAIDRSKEFENSEGRKYAGREGD